jgi:LAO/AO transport system kinase
MNPRPEDQIDARVTALVRRDKRALGRAVSLCEDTRPDAAAERRMLIDALARHPGRRRARLVGITGPPGAGKSTMVSELALRLVATQAGWTVGVLAVDPTSARSGGAFLGDRVRVRFPPGETRLFFRSQASELALGGLGRHTFAVCRLLQHLFDCVLVETVGVGQSEIEVRQLVERAYLLLPPGFGDSVQLMKAGVMEVPDAVILGKQDLPGAGAGAAAVAAELARRGGRAVPLHRVSARTGLGLDAVVEEISRMEPAPGRGPLDRREAHFFGEWVRSEYGRAGLAALEARGGAAAYLAATGGYDGALARFPPDVRGWLRD